MWYTVSLFFESVHNDSPKEGDLWEQRIILVKAVSEEEALQQATRFGVDNQEVYTSGTGDRVQWVFRRPGAVFTLFDNDIRSGVEVFAQFLRAADVKSLFTRFEDAE